MPMYPIQPSFAAGELADALTARVDLSKYSVGAKTMRNFIAHPHGGASNRPGTEFIAETKTHSKKSRLIPFLFSTQQAYVLEFGNLYLRVYKDGGQIVSGATPVEVVTPYLEADISAVKFTQSADVLYLCHPSHPPKTLSRSSHTSWTLADFAFKNGPYRQANNTDTTITPSATTGTITLTASTGIFQAGHVGAFWRIGHDVSGTYKEGYVKITAFTSATAVSATVQADLGAVSATKQWAEGAWSAVRGWPSCVVFYQDRLVFANSPSDPQTVWLSRTGDYTNFGRSAPVVDDDGITAPLVSRQVNAIRSMVSLGDIIGLTAGGEWKIGPAGTETIAPTSISARQQGYRGAAVSDPVIVGNRIVYVQEMGSTVRDLGYRLDVDSYTGDDLSVMANHLFRRHEILQIAYQQEPDSVVWCVRDDGVLLGLTYLREQEVFAWHRHDTDGLFESVCTIPGQERDEAWFIVNRTVGGQIRRYVERLSDRLPTSDIKDAFFVDCGLTYDGSPATVISGLDHLEGKTVAILADGNVIKPQAVFGGEVTLSPAASKVHIGLPYTSDLETLNIELNPGDGTVQGRKKRIAAVLLRLLETRGAMVGPSFDKLNELKMRATEGWGEPIDMFTGDKKINISAGWSTEGRVCIRMAEPLPITVLAVVPQVDFVAQGV